MIVKANTKTKIYRDSECLDSSLLIILGGSKAAIQKPWCYV